MSLDIFDSVVDLEGQAYEEGKALAIIDAFNGEMFENGVKSGFMRGYALSLEIGFLEAVASETLALNAKSDAKGDACAIIDDQKSTPSSTCIDTTMKKTQLQSQPTPRTSKLLASLIERAADEEIGIFRT